MAFKCDAKFEFHLSEEAMKKFHGTTANAWKMVTREVVGEARRRSPVSDVNPCLNPEDFAKTPRGHRHTGYNRRNINPNDALNSSYATTIDPNNVVSEVFTTSGYGGYLEVGTRKMVARPYIVPAAEHVILHGRGKEILTGIV